MQMLSVLQQEDHTVVYIIEGNRIQQESEVPVGDKFSEGFKEGRGTDGNIYPKMKIESAKKLNDMKWSRTKILMDWLKEERTMVQVDIWKTKKARSIGFGTHIHPTATWKPAYREEL